MAIPTGRSVHGEPQPGDIERILDRAIIMSAPNYLTPTHQTALDTTCQLDPESLMFLNYHPVAYHQDGVLCSLGWER